MKGHAIMIALPYQGHLNPFVDLAMKLASKGITVTFVHTEYAHNQIVKSQQNPTATAAAGSREADIFSEARASGLDIRYTTISDGFPLDFDRDLNFVEYWETLINDFPSQVALFVGDIIASSDPSSPPFLVSDTFASWPTTVARDYNLVSVSFWTQPAFVFAIDSHIHLLTQNGHYPPTKDDDEQVIDYIPGVDSISTKDLMSHLLGVDPTILVEIVFRAFEEVVKADFILHNTVQELEHQTLSALNQEQPTYAVGPCIKTSSSVAKSMLHEADCSNWLGPKPPGSVLYVSFGSISQTRREVIHEIARGLLSSDVSFVWAIRARIVSDVVDDDDDTAGVLPFGFENDVEGRGLVVPWCDQLAVLSNPAVGGFLTHCGWNSTMESMWCGVPMICYPISYDQPTNRKLVVDDWKIGINLCDGASVGREEVAEKINVLMMSGERSDAIRSNIKKVRSKLRSAWNEDGSSHKNFDQFLKDLNDKIEAKKEIK